MLCGGVTMYTPLVENGCGPGKRVGIVGIGGLGHFGILFAKALGADRVVGISRSASKRADVLKLGAHEYIATSDEENWSGEHAGTLDLIICTVSSPNMPPSNYLKLLDTKGRFVQVGAPEDKLPPIHPFDLIPKGKSVGGSTIGSLAQIRAMLTLAEEKKIRPWVEERPMDDANQVILDLENGLPRYRYVLVNK
jgi:alcohol dehydrogenase (NADP+)